MQLKQSVHPFRAVVLLGLVVAAALITIPAVGGHGVEGEDRAFLEGSTGAQPGAFLYLGAKHMVTGYDHLLFLVGVIFFLFRAKEVMLYVSMFTIGHSATLLLGVLADIQANAFLIDAVIGLSVVYKGFDNLGGFKRVLGFQPDTRGAVLVFGLFHGFGLATKLQEFSLSSDGLVANIVMFNVGVEIGQVLALGAILIGMGYWRRHADYMKHAFAANVALMTGGFLLTGYQLGGYFLT